MPFFNIFNGKTPPKPYFCFFKNIRNQPYLRSTLFQHFQQYNTPAVLYFSNSNRIKPQEYLIPAFSMDVNPSRTLFLLFEQYNTPAVPQPYFIFTFYFCIFNKVRPHPYLSCVLFQPFQQNRTLAAPCFKIFNERNHQPHLIFAF